jgi:hypothetical protein
MLRLAFLAAVAYVAYRAVQENLPRIPRGFDLPGGAPPVGRGAAKGNPAGGEGSPAAPQ